MTTSAKLYVLPVRRRADSELSDQALVAACGVRDARALAVLYERHSVPVYRFLSRMVGPAAPELDDLVQQTFLEAWVCAARYRGDSSARTWLFGIASNLARNLHRKQSRRLKALFTLFQSKPAPQPTPHERASTKQLLERLRVAVDELPHDLKTAYVMCDLEGVRGTEAAKVLGVRPGTIWRRLHHARKQLRERIGGEP